MTRKEIIDLIKEKKSYLCVGLDTDIEKIPGHLKKHPEAIFEFNKQIIDATKKYCIAYKPNIAFYESMGATGWVCLKKTVDYIGDSHFKIADAKRGDIGNTAEKYAEAFFKEMQFDAITLSPYMGEDSITPFLNYKNKFVIILALTSNAGSKDFQLMEENKEPLYERVIRKANNWGTADNTMFVIGATHPEYFYDIRQCAPDNFLLVPGVGAQGGDLQQISTSGMNAHCGLIVNSTRDIIYASQGEDFAEKAGEKSHMVQQQMENILKEKGLI